MVFLPLLATLMALQAGQVPSQHLPKAPEGQKVVARVDGVEIKAAEVEALLWDWRGEEVLQDVITFQLIRAEAHRRNIVASDVEVLKNMDDHLANVKQSLAPNQDVRAAMREQGFPMSRLYLSIKSDLILTKLAEAEFDPKGFVKVSTLVFTPKSAAAEDLADALNRAQLAYDRLAKGDSWQAVLDSTQDNPGLVGAKGLLGWRQLSAFPEPARAELTTAGKVAKPVQTSNGIQIFKVEALGTEAAGEGLAALRQMAIPDMKSEILRRIRAGAKVERLYP